MAYVGSPIRFAPLLLAGCSLLYNPNNIPQGNGDAKLPDTPERRDGPPDAEIIADANPSLLALMTLEPGFIVEGTGDGSSRPEVLVIHGKQMVPGAIVSITGAGSGSGGSATSVEVVGDGSATVSNDGETLAVEVVAHVDQTIDAGSSVVLSVTVTQPTGSGSDISQSLTWNEDGLAELIAGSGSATVLSGTNQYSEVAITGGTVTASGTAPVIVRSSSSITMTPAIDVSGSAATAGPGGNSGGGAGLPGSGSGGGSTTGSAPGAGGGGFATAGMAGAASGGAGGAGGGVNGDPLVSSYAVNQSSGGGGADGVGGGGGGTIELTAAGTLSIGAVTSNGASGAAGANVLLTSEGGGGGGTGGVIVLRGGASAGFGALAVGGGGGGAAGAEGGGKGGSGGAGRIRVDSPSIASALPANGHQGLSFDSTVPAVFDNSNPMITIDGSVGDAFELIVLTSSGQDVGNGDDKFTLQFEGSGQAIGMPIFPNAAAYQLCLIPVDGNVGTDPESTNCIHVAYIPPVQ